MWRRDTARGALLTRRELCLAAMVTSASRLPARGWGLDTPGPTAAGAVVKMSVFPVSPVQPSSPSARGPGSGIPQASPSGFLPLPHSKLGICFFFVRNRKARCKPQISSVKFLLHLIWVAELPPSAFPQEHGRALPSRSSGCCCVPAASWHSASSCSSA